LAKETMQAGCYCQFSNFVFWHVKILALCSTGITNTVLWENLVGIKFGDFSKNIIFLKLASFKFGDSVTQPKSDVTTMM